ncbi:MAG: PhnD/SsuA/transferrin family substrate-binding protein [Pseudomonadota bacterium]
MSLAALAMYDWPEVREETDRLWAAIRDSLRNIGVAAPDALSRDADMWSVWRDPSLCLGQTCGLPFAAKLAGDVALLGAPVYDLADCPRGTYRSEVIVRADDPAPDLAALRGARFAFNMRESQSGWACFAAQIEDPAAYFGELIQTGAHRASVRAVAGGAADAACIDAVAWRLAERHDADLTAGLRVIHRTAPTPGLPFITAPRPEETLARMRLVIETAIETQPPLVRDALFLNGFAKKRPEDYAPLAKGWPAETA